MTAHVARSWLEHYFTHGSHRGKQRVLRWLMNSGIPKTGIKYLRSAYGPKLHVRNWDLTNFFGITGSYGTEISREITQLPPDGVFIDIGANHGVFSLLAASTLARGQVLAFEPNPVVYKTLLDNIALNGTDNIIPFNFAVGADDSIVRLECTRNHSGVTRVRGDAAGTPIPLVNPFRIELVENVCRARPVCVKIDVEGFELGVVRALVSRSIISSQLRQVIVEIDAENLSAYDATPAQIYALLAEHGFTARHGLHGGHYDEFFTR